MFFAEWLDIPVGGDKGVAIEVKDSYVPDRYVNMLEWG